MKKYLTILLLLCCFKSHAQTPAIDTIYVVDTLARDTVPMLLPVLDSSHYYDVYRPTGTLLKHNADSYFLVPTGGRRIKLGLINNTRLWIEGYEVYKTRLDFKMELVSTLNSVKEQISAPFIKTGIGIPVTGF
jgi:hypothetical protein